MAKLLDFIMKVNTAGPDDLVEDIAKMADPDSFSTKSDMQDHFEEVLGYDPLTHFPRKFLEDKLRELADIAPFSVRDQIYAKTDTIIQQSLECVDDLDTSILMKILSQVVEYNVGWNANLDDGVTIEDCISMSLYGENYESAEEEPDLSDDESDGEDDDYPDEDEDDEDFDGFGNDYD